MALRRRPPSRGALPRLLVVCEGHTEADYLRHLARELSIGTDRLVIEAGVGVPRSVVQRAVGLMKAEQTRARRERESWLAYAEVWAVIDRDDHPNFQEATAQAAANGVRLAISNPCIELWLLLHFIDLRRYTDRSVLQSTLGNHLPEFDKRIGQKLFATLKGGRADASRRAADIDAWHGTRGTRGDNPSTQFYELVRSLEMAGRDRRLRG